MGLHPEHVLVGSPLGEQQGSQKPARRRPAHDDVVGVDVQRVPAQVVGGKGDGIGGGDQVAIAEVDHGGVLAHAWPHDHPGIVAGLLVEDRLQQITGKLTDRQERHRARSIPP